MVLCTQCSYVVTAAELTLLHTLQEGGGHTLWPRGAAAAVPRSAQAKADRLVRGDLELAASLSQCTLFLLFLSPDQTERQYPMSVVNTEGSHMQAALNRATGSYKARIGNRSAWSAFYTWLDHHLGPCCPTPIAALWDIYHRLEQIAEDPELLVRCMLSAANTRRLLDCCLRAQC